MYQKQSNDSMPLYSKRDMDDSISCLLNSLLTTCSCTYLSGKDYELDIANAAIDALNGNNETADVYLYAAIERCDWREVEHIYHTVFRPHIVNAANHKLMDILFTENNNKYS